MPAHIYVLAGVNGAGKSSIGGAALLARGVPCFNPDLAARGLRQANPGMALETANGEAWETGRALLERALNHDLNFAFETTLGAHTMTDMLLAGAQDGAQVHVWFAGLSSPELHLQRVKERVQAGGHDIPEHKIRERYATSRSNLIKLLPALASLRVYDNSAQGDPKTGDRPKPLLLLHMAQGRIVSRIALDRVPEWAKPILAVAMKINASNAGTS
ncbi:MAG: ZTL protein [Burkholderiaceae bacterium]|nr:MAG: ZTL protein [Burkholderiaceae bacterium]